MRKLAILLENRMYLKSKALPIRNDTKFELMIITEIASTFIQC